MKYVTSLCDLFFPLNEEAYATALNDSHLLVRMIVFRSYQKWTKAKAADHHAVSNKHLPFNSNSDVLDGNRRPIQMLGQHAMAITARLIIW
jgi:hypothetical protein